MSFIQAIFDKASRRGPAAPKGGDGTQEAILAISASDAGWSAKLADGDGARWQRRASCIPEGSAATPAERLAEAVACFAADQPQANVTRVILFMDDPDLELVDHRFAKLNNFEPRGLKEFGSQQIGGRPVVFGSVPFGDSSAREIQKRVLGFLPEEKLATYFFALGKIATALVAAIPADACSLGAQSHEGGIFATLRVHGYFSTFLIANAQTGIIAMRQFSFGALSLADAYAAEHGLSLTESSAALGARSRLPPAAIVKDGGAPEHQTGTFAALSPLLHHLREDIAATIDYFRFQRLAGRPAHLGLTFTGPTLAGLDSWLADALGLQVEIVENTLTTSEGITDMPTLNLLEGSRAALLKMGNQPFEFSKGHFVPMSGGRFDMPTRKLEEKIYFPWLDKLSGRFGAQQITLTRDRLLRPLAAFGVIGLLVIANIYLLTGPAEQRLSDDVFAYGSVAEASVAAIKSGAAANAQESDQPALWADSLLAVGQALPPAMKLEHMELTPAAGKGGAGTDLNLAMTGALPPAAAGNLKSVAVFIDQLSKDKSFSRRFPQVRFTGAGKSTDQINREMNFHVAALSGELWAMSKGLFKPVLVGSLAVLVGSAQFFTYAAYVEPRSKTAQDLQALSDILQLERQKKGNIRLAEDRGVTVPDLLSRVQEIAAQNSVTLTGVQPVPADPEQFKLGLVARYEGFLGFLARFETLRVSITGFDISRAMDNPGSLVVSLNFRHAQIASPIGDQRIKDFEARLRSIALRDPFDPAAGNIRMVADANADDLTWTYHLTSISLIGNMKYATIDGRDYNVGDQLKGLVVSAIGNDNVTLTGRENGKERQRFLRFRSAREDRI